MQDILLFAQHHLALSLALVAILALLVLLEFIKIKRGTNMLKPGQAVDLMNHKSAPVIDIRHYDTFLAGHIVNSVSLPLAELENKLKKIEKFKSQPIIIVCATGTESQQAATILLQNGFQPQILAGGIRAWREASMPLVKG